VAWINTGMIVLPTVVANPSTNRARRSLTSLTRRTPSPLRQTSHHYTGRLIYYVRMCSSQLCALVRCPVTEGITAVDLEVTLERIRDGGLDKILLFLMGGGLPHNRLYLFRNADRDRTTKLPLVRKLFVETWPVLWCKSLLQYSTFKETVIDSLHDEDIAYAGLHALLRNFSF